MRPRLRSRLREQEQLGRDAADRLEHVGADAVRYREALDALPVGVVIRDDQGREVYRNGRAAAPTGDLHADVLVSRALDALLERSPDGAPFHDTVELRGPPARAVELSVAALSSGGVIGILEDVSERRQLDSVRRDFIANVNHELRTPVGALELLAEALEAETDPAVVRRLVGRMSAEAARAHVLIEDLLDLSRIETGDRPPMQPVSMIEVVERARQRVQALEERSGVSVEVTRLDEAEIDGIPDDLVSALSNLLDNALKYSEPASLVELEVIRRDDTVDVVVRDNGIGIAARDLDRIFERFYRVDRARDRRTGGSGLGLAIVRHVAEHHGGQVLVTSAEGAGSTFTMRLRARSAGAP